MTTLELQEPFTGQAILDEISRHDCEVTDHMRVLAERVAKALGGEEIPMSHVRCSEELWGASLCVRNKILNIMVYVTRSSDPQDALDRFAVHAAVSFLLGRDGDDYCKVFLQKTARQKRNRAAPKVVEHSSL